MTYNEDLMVIIDNKLDNLAITVDNLESAQRFQTKQSKIPNFSNRLENVEKKQEEMLRLLTALRSELAGISSGMARRDSLMLGSSVVSGLSIRRDSLIGGDQSVRRDSLILGSDFHGRSATIPVMEVEPWEPTQSVQELIDQLFERQFTLSPWVREKRMRNQLRLILKDHLEAGPKRRSTVTKVVHDAHQIFPLWRNQIREKMFQDWENIQQLSPRDAAKIIFEQFEKCKASDEMDSMILYAEHMVEVGQYLRRKLIERKEKNGRQNGSVTVTNSKFWYEVRKKIQEVLDSEKRIDAKDEAENDEDSDDINNDSAVHTTSADSEEEYPTTDVAKKAGDL